MKADLTRDTFDPKNQFRQVLAQQGRVQLDAELNEQSALDARLHDTTTADIVGDCGGPAGGAAFGMSAIAGQPGDFLLAAGRYYVNGSQCELEQPVSYRLQPDLPRLPPLPSGLHLVYLDVWQRHLTFLDNPLLLETALGGGGHHHPREVCFTANLRGGAVSTDEDPGALHIVDIRLAGTHRRLLPNNSEVHAAIFAKRITVELDGLLHATSVDGPNFPQQERLHPNPVCFLTAELPYPFLRSEMQDVGAGDSQLPEVLVGYLPLILRANVQSRETTLMIQPAAQALDFLNRYFARGVSHLLIRVTLKGNFIWRNTAEDELKRNGPAGWLDDDAYGVSRSQHPNALHGLIDPKLASGDRRRRGDFEMWFWLIPGRG